MIPSFPQKMLSFPIYLLHLFHMLPPLMLMYTFMGSISIPWSTPNLPAIIISISSVAIPHPWQARLQPLQLSMQLSEQPCFCFYLLWIPSPVQDKLSTLLCPPTLKLTVFFFLAYYPGLHILKHILMQSYHLIFFQSNPFQFSPIHLLPSIQPPIPCQN